MEEIRHDIGSLRERVAVTETEIKASAEALRVAKESVSKNNLAAIANFVLAVLALVIAWLKK